MIEIQDTDAVLVSDALTTLWHRSPTRRAEVTALIERTPGLYIEGDDYAEDAES